MVKLLKNEWKRYRAFSLIMFIVTVGMGILLSISLQVIFTMELDEDVYTSIFSFGSIILIAIFILIMPFAAGIYCLLSYISDIGRKGMIFLTPVPTWKIILSKIIFTIGMFTALYVVSTGGMMLAGLVSDINSDLNKESGIADDIADMFRSFASFKFNYFVGESNKLPDILNGFLVNLVSVLHFSSAVIGCISLARLAANSVGVQVLLSILFYWIVSMTESTINAIISMIFTDENYFLHMLNSYMNVASFEFFVSIVYAAVMYIICVCLTDRKVNLVS